MKRLAVICARGGSKGITNKNLRMLCGKPLLAHTVEQARKSAMFDWIAVSSDSADILQAGDTAGADFMIERPSELANDVAPKIPAIRHCAASVEKTTSVTIDIIVDLDATAPLRSIEDIKAAIEKLEVSDADNLVSGMIARRSPYFNLVEEQQDGRVKLSKIPETPIARRQDAPRCFDLNASIFAWKRGALFSPNDYALGDNTILFEMPEERSIDIDTELDFAFVEFMMSRRKDSSQ
ncbi:acylneuraminate cytidylyltransferase family protein [Rhodospirillales bacterium]|nr:acylneuraminate cytidylyltransferase family protein [Rhodospirillales bacterium]